MKTLVFDTETTGIRPKGRVPLSAEPYVIQLAAILYDEQRPVGHMSCFIAWERDGAPVYPPKEKFFLDNGLTEEVVRDFGLPPLAALTQFHRLLTRSDRVVAHNMRFDSPMMFAAFRRLPQENAHVAWAKADKRCTMLSLTDVMKLPSKWGKGYKWPNLDEAYRKYVNHEGFSGAHDAMVDVQACADVLFALEQQDIPLLPA